MQLLPRLFLISCAALSLAAVSARAQTPAQAQSGELGSVKLAIDLVQRGKGTEALATSAEFRDPAARKLIFWLVLRNDWRALNFDRASAFLRENPDWPGVNGLLRRRVESLLYDENRDARTVRAFFGDTKPLSGEGKLALARALLAGGDRAAAAALVKDAWRDDTLSASIENEVLSTFAGILIREDHKARADKFFYDGLYAGALRSAERGGADLVAVERARQAMRQRAKNASALLNAVPAQLRSDPGIIFARVEQFRKADKFPEAAKTFFEAPRDPALLADPDSWWKEARIIVRGLLDRGDPKTAYRLAVHAGTPDHENYQADQHFTAGWVALRFLKDAPTAAKHFKAVEATSIHPTTQSRALYWHGRAAEALNDRAGAQGSYQRAAAYSTSYYGQLARARLGLKELTINRPVEPTATERAQFSKLESTRALRLLYATSNVELTIPFYSDVAERVKSDAELLLYASVAYEHRDPRGMVLVGRSAQSRGILIDTIAFPMFGLPDHPKDQPSVDKAVTYAIARQESQFTQTVVSSANAYGLMQVIAPTGRGIAKRLGIPFDHNKLKNDPAYNARLGAAELGHLLDTFNGSYILTFVGYNAGPGRSRQWIEKYGDPRDPKVDAVDWVERVPFSETRFYIQRVMENMQVYRVLFGDQAGFRIEADLSRGRPN